MQKNILKSVQWQSIFKGMVYLLLAGSFFYVGSALAADEGLAEIAGRLGEEIQPFAQLMTYIAYIAGIAFMIGALFKFKQHKDNPTQIPLGTPLAMLVIGVVLIFLPSLWGPVGQSIFGENKKEGHEFTWPGSGTNNPSS